METSRLKPKQNKLRSWRLFMLACAAASGCGARAVEPSPQTTERASAVDPSLPRAAQAKQQVMREILLNLQEGYPAEKIPFLLRGVRFNERQSRFLDGAKSLARWEFHGAPFRDEVPVLLHFAPAEDRGAELKTVERTYVVKGANGRYVVSRK